MAYYEPDRLFPLSLITTYECNCGAYFGEGLYRLGKRWWIADLQGRGAVSREDALPLKVGEVRCRNEIPLVNLRGAIFSMNNRIVYK